MTKAFGTVLVGLAGALCVVVVALGVKPTLPFAGLGVEAEMEQ